MSTGPKSINTLYSMNYRSNSNIGNERLLSPSAVRIIGKMVFRARHRSIRKPRQIYIYIYFWNKRMERKKKQIILKWNQTTSNTSFHLSLFSTFTFEHHRVPVAIGRGRFVVKVRATIFVFPRWQPPTSGFHYDRFGT